MEDKDFMNQYLTGNEFNVRSNASVPSSPQQTHDETNNDDDLESSTEQDVSLLVSPGFVDFGRNDGEKKKNKTPTSKRKSQLFNDLRVSSSNQREQKQTSTSPSEKDLLETSFCPSLGLGSIESEQDSRDSLNSPNSNGKINNDNDDEDNGGYVFKSNLYRNNDWEKSPDEKTQSRRSSQEKDDVTLEIQPKPAQDNLDSPTEAIDLARTDKVDSEPKILDERLSLSVTKSYRKLDISQKNLSVQSEKSNEENTNERRHSWNEDVTQKLADVSDIMDSMHGDHSTRRLREKDSKEKKDTDLNSDVDSTDSNDNFEVASNDTDDFNKKLQENDETEFGKKYSLEELKKKYPSPEKTDENDPVGEKYISPQRRTSAPSNAVSFIKNLLTTPPKFFSPDRKRKSDIFQSILDGVRVKNDGESPVRQSRDGIFSDGVKKNEEKDDNAGVGHWKLSLSIPQENDLSMNVSPISCASPKLEEEYIEQDSYEEILGEKILEDEQATRTISRRHSSAYFSPVDTNSESSMYSSFSSKDMGSGSVEVSKLTRRHSFSRVGDSRKTVLSGRRLSVDKMYKSSVKSKTVSSCSSPDVPKRRLSRSSLSSKEGSATPPLPTFSNMRDLTSAKKQVGASSLALIERLQGASQRRKLLVSRSGESREAKDYVEQSSASKFTDHAQPSVPPGRSISTGTVRIKTKLSKEKSSAFKPFKARPLPSTTTYLGNGGQLGVPKVIKKPSTNPLSPKLGSDRRQLSPSRYIQKVRAEEKAKREFLRSTYENLPEYKVPNSIPKKKLSPYEDPYIPFKARPIETDPKPLRSVDNLAPSIKLEKTIQPSAQKKFPPHEDPYKAFKALPLPVSSKEIKGVGAKRVVSKTSPGDQTSETSKTKKTLAKHRSKIASLVEKPSTNSSQITSVSKHQYSNGIREVS